MDDAFLRAIRADPEADLPRLVYADWLDEHDDPARAEFIRVQCALAKLPDHDDAYAALEDREHELLAEHEAQWLGDGPTPDEWTFRRGFVADIDFDPANPPYAALTGHAVTSLTLSPHFDTSEPESVLGIDGTEAVCEIDLTRASGVWHTLDLGGLLHRWDTPAAKSLRVAGPARLGPVLSGTPVARTLKVLQAGGLAGLPGTRYNEVAEVADALKHAPLERLDVYDTNLAELGPLLHAGFAGSLTSLDVSYNPLGPEAYREYGRAGRDLALKHLDVSGTTLCGPMLQNVLAARCCDALSRLALNNADALNVEWLLDTPFWAQATELSVHQSRVREDHFERLARHPGPPTLRSLDLGDNDLGPRAARLLSEAAWARSITWLNLAANAFEYRAVAHLSEPWAFPYLRTLHLGHNAGLFDDALELLVNSATLSRLRVLTLTSTGVTDYGVELLMNAPHFMLSGLGLSATSITAAGVRTLANSPRLARLNWLDLSDNAALHSDALLPLAESPYLSPLCDLDISRTGASTAVRDLLRQRLGRRLLD
jgi:uncharacterized protein (TIGR02996 family)